LSKPIRSTKEGSRRHNGPISWHSNDCQSKSNRITRLLLGLRDGRLINTDTGLEMATTLGSYTPLEVKPKITARIIEMVSCFAPRAGLLAHDERCLISQVAIVLRNATLYQLSALRARFSSISIGSETDGSHDAAFKVTSCQTAIF
jgi:hypothetical protein